MRENVVLANLEKRRNSDGEKGRLEKRIEG